MVVLVGLVGMGFRGQKVGQKWDPEPPKTMKSESKP